MLDGQTAPLASRGARWLRTAEFLLIAGGASALLWCGFVIADARLTQNLARQALVSTPAAAAAAIYPVALPAAGAPLADLTIPRLQLSVMVLQGSDDETLRHGLGHIEHTALPGERGNVAIAGHRDTFFRPLRDVRLGDDVFLQTAQERFHYQVSSLDVVKPTDVSVLDATGAPTLTLITCYPFWVLGRAPDRFVVRATRVTDSAAAVLQP